MSQYQQVSLLLIEIRSEMETIGLWQQEPPAPEALASSQPFCVDTLNFSEWVQWLLLPRLEMMIQARQPLPQNSEIQPMAEEVFKQQEENTSRLLDLIGQLDQALKATH